MKISQNFVAVSEYMNFIVLEKFGGLDLNEFEVKTIMKGHDIDFFSNPGCHFVSTS